MIVRFRHNDPQMNNPPHPGLSVRHDCLEPLGLIVTEAAKKLGVSRKQLSDIVNGHSGISPQMAIRLDKAFGGGGEHVVPIAGDLRFSPSDETGRPNQGRAAIDSDVGRQAEEYAPISPTLQGDPKTKPSLSVMVSGPEATTGSIPKRRKTNGTTAPITAASLNDQIKG